jgi:hypothetical protein
MRLLAVGATLAVSVVLPIGPARAANRVIASPPVWAVPSAACRSQESVTRVRVEGNVSCGTALASAQHMVQNYAVLQNGFRYDDNQLAGEFYDWRCKVNANPATFTEFSCQAVKYAVFRENLRGPARMTFDWTFGPGLDAHRCGSLQFGELRLIQGTVNPGESCLDLNDFFRQAENVFAGYRSPPKGYNPDENSTIDRYYTDHIAYQPNVLVPCRLGQTTIECRPTASSDLGPAGRYSCTEHFIARTTFTSDGHGGGSGQTSFSDSWVCARSVYRGRVFVRGQVYAWSVSESGSDPAGQGW